MTANVFVVVFHLTVSRPAQLEKRKQQEILKNHLFRTFYKMYISAVNVIPASYIFFNSLKIALPYLFICNAQFYSMFWFWFCML